MQQYFAKNINLDLEDGDYHHIKNVMKMKLMSLPIDMLQQNQR